MPTLTQFIKRLLARLRPQGENEERYRIMAESAPVFVWMSGADRLCDWFNPPWLEFRGRTLGQEIGHGWEEGIHPDDLGRCWDAFYSVYEARREFTVEYRLLRHDGEYRWMLTRGIPASAPTASSWATSGRSSTSTTGGGRSRSASSS